MSACALPLRCKSVKREPDVPSCNDESAFAPLVFLGMIALLLGEKSNPAAPVPTSNELSVVPILPTVVPDL